MEIFSWNVGGWSYLIIWGSLILVFERAMYCGYVVDDQARKERMTMLKKAWKEGKITDFFSRRGFVWEACYGAGIFANARQEYAFNLVLHGVVSSLIYGITHCLPAALLYLVNPVNNQTVLWMNGRRYALSLVALLLAWKFKALAILAFGFACWLHVSAVAMPLLFLWTPWWPLVPVALGIGAWLSFKHFKGIFLSRKSEYERGFENQALSWKKSVTYVKTVGYYFFNCLFPFKLGMYHNFLQYFGMYEETIKEGYSFNYEFYKGVLALAILGALMFTPVGFWAFWFLLFISQWCNVCQVTMTASDRYCSIPNVGIMVILGTGITLLPQPWSLAVFALFATMYVMKYVPLFRAYTSMENFFHYHLTERPSNTESAYWCSKFYMDMNDIYSAWAIVKRGLRFNPNDFKLALRMLEIMMAMHKYPQALKVVEFARRRIPLGESEEATVFFNDLEAQLKKTIEAGSKVRPSIHNNGRPIVKNAAKA